ncbi:MAG: DUF6171 family protein [Ruminococcus sp.]|nr:DUF6171 family protein [Ruminococcus sp.]
MSKMSIPFCRKCLLADIDPAGIYREIQEMTAAIPRENRTEESEYRRRLDLCGSCDKLGEGICGVCGCFVELRAAKKNMQCPRAGELRLW